MYHIRDATNRDIPFLWDMLYESFYVPDGQAPYSKDILQEPAISKYISQWGKPGDIGLVAEDDDNKRIGAVWLRLFDEVNKGFGYMDAETPELGIAVVPDFRGHGVGSLLMRKIEERARQYGYLKISLSVDPENPARKLYERRGYIHTGWCDTSWTMVKELS